jgi:hypothetical protein
LKVVFKGRVVIVVPDEKDVKVDLHGYLLALGWRVQSIEDYKETTYFKTFDNGKDYGLLYSEVENLKILIGADEEEDEEDD